MAYGYDKDEIKNSLSIEQVSDILNNLGADPKIQGNVILAATICHNEPGMGTHKLYYYDNTKLFKCYTNCGEYFDIFELVIKAKTIQENIDWELPQALYFVANYFGFAYTEMEEISNDWKILNNYDRINNIDIEKKEIELKDFDSKILDRLAYPKITPWLREGITQEVIEKSRIGYYPKGAQISIPHYDENGRFIGLRGRALVKEESDLFGKYRPMKINNLMYNHPLGFNLYGLNDAKENIKLMKKVIVFEGEKSVLLYGSYFGVENNISVATCGSSLSAYQFELLLKYGATEVIIAYDKQFKEINDDEFKKLTKSLTVLNNKYGTMAQISFMFDKENKLGYKDSPIDCGKEIFLELFKNRIIL